LGAGVEAGGQIDDQDQGDAEQAEDGDHAAEPSPAGAQRPEPSQACEERDRHQ
jgi:hypothetical protein